MNTIYLNNAATSYPKAPGMPEAVSNSLKNLPGAANRGGINDFDVFAETRKELALLLGVSRPEHIGLGPNATWGLNTGIHGLGLTKEDVVLTTTAEHNSMLRPLYALSLASGAALHYLPVDASGRVSVAAWTEALEQFQPSLCAFTHASNVTGAVNDIVTLTGLAKNHGALVLVDLAQSLGCQPIKLEEWGVDLAAFTGHKYLLGPQGTGGLYVRPDLDLSPLLTGGTGIHSDLDTMPPHMPLHIEAGTNNEPGYYGLLHALRWQRENPWPHMSVFDLFENLKAQLRELGATVIDPGQPSTPIVSFTMEGFSPAYLGETLAESYDIIVRTGLHCAPRIFENLGIDSQEGTVRISLSRFSTPAQIDEVLGALAEIIAAGI